MRKKILFVTLVLLALLGVLLYLFLSPKSEPEPGTGFFAVAGYGKAQVDEVWAEYYNTSVSLRKEEQERLLTTLEHASFRTTVKKEEPYPYTPTEYALTFSVDGEEIPYTFYWFTGKDYGANDTFEYTDSRFDVMIDGTIYVFDQDSTLQEEKIFWNEEISQIAYEAACRSQGVEVPDPAKLAGYTDSVTSIKCYTSEPPHYNVYDDPSDYIALADVIVLARSEGYQSIPVGEHFFRNYEVFQIERVFKSNNILDPEMPIYMEILYGPFSNSSFQYPPIDEPFYTEGQLYLLCLSFLDPEDGITYATRTTPYSSALVLNDTCYAYYNTEVAPFHLFTLDNVENLCSK